MPVLRPRKRRWGSLDPARGRIFDFSSALQYEQLLSVSIRRINATATPQKIAAGGAGAHAPKAVVFHRISLDVQSGCGGRYNSICPPSDGPRIAEPTRRGFGMEMIESVISYQLHGQSTLTFEETGLRCVIRLPFGEETGDGPVGSWRVADR